MAALGDPHDSIISRTMKAHPYSRQIMKSPTVIAFLLTSLASTASAQSVNIDIGMNLAFFAGVPSGTYGAAAAQPGAWNAFMPTLTDAPLATLDGQASMVTLRSDATSTFNVFPGVMVQGDDQRLMEDFHLTPNLNMTSTWTFGGLSDGDYEIYTYASDPSLSGLLTEIAVPLSMDPPQVVGAGWPGTHGLGTTYALHQVSVTGGALTIAAYSPGGQLDTGVMNGIQLVFLGDGLGTRYCAANVNSTGTAAVMGATGSRLVSANNVTLQATQLPPNSFGFFITSQSRGFVQNPGGSAGNLCLSGAVGRYVGPGEIQNSGAGSAISLALNLNAMPTPLGFVAVQAGETWNFSAWFRDASPSGPTSNFADGYELAFQ